MIDTKFGILFTLELLHKFFTDQLCRDFVITPSALTAQVLNGHKIIVKQYQHQLYAGVKMDNTGLPFVLPDEGMQMTFFLKLNTPLFFNYTNLPFTYNSGKIYHFTNRNNNSSNGKNFLSLPTSYNNATTYKPGDLATNGSGTVFEAIRTSTGITPPADTVLSDSWIQVDPATARNRYMSEADAVQWLPSKSTYHFTADQSSAGIQVWAYDLTARDYTRSVLTQTVNFTHPARSFTLDLTGLPPGRYKMNINGQEGGIYLNDELIGVDAFAVIEIFQESSLPVACQLLDAGNSLKSPLYSLYFLNRSTIWKYIFAKGIINGITDNASVYQFAVGSPPSGTAVSVKPIPLNEAALSLRLTVGSQNYSPIECASPQRLTSTVQNGDAYCCSEIFLNY
jgi:hypothetical protein